MIGSIANPPDYKIFISEAELEELEKGKTLGGKFLDHNTSELVDITLKRDSKLKEGVTRDSYKEIVVSDLIAQELGEKGFVGGLRLNGNTVKVTLVIKEKLRNLGLSSDDQMGLEWALEDLEERING